MPKIANPRNHQGADTDASAQGFISKLELGSKYTRHSGAGTWTPKWVTAGFFMGWSRGFSEGVEEFLKLCFHSNTGLSVSVKGVLSSVFILICDFLSRALSSVLILIWDSLSRAFCVFSCKVQLLFTGA